MPAPVTSTDEPIATKANEDRRYKLCRCGQCGQVHRCTPRFDFYARHSGLLFNPEVDGKPDSPIYCAVCTADGQL